MHSDSHAVLPEGMHHEERLRRQAIASHHRDIARFAHRAHFDARELERETTEQNEFRARQARILSDEYAGVQHLICILALAAAALNDFFLAGSGIEFLAGKHFAGHAAWKQAGRILVTGAMVAAELGVGMQRVRIENWRSSGLLPRAQRTGWIWLVLSAALAVGIPALTLASNLPVVRAQDPTSAKALLAGVTLLALVCHALAIYGTRAILEGFAYLRCLRRDRGFSRRRARLARGVEAARQAMRMAFVDFGEAIQHSPLPVAAHVFDTLTMEMLRQEFGPTIVIPASHGSRSAEDRRATAGVLPAASRGL